MDLMRKLAILTESAKYDAACTSSGASARQNRGDGIGSTIAAGCCHTFSADGRCVTLLKVLMSNECVYDCRYCVNRRSNEVERASFTPRELAELTLEFYRRNYIEGLFLSSGVCGSPDGTMERMIRTLELLRYDHRFYGYIHAKAIPGASPELVERMGLLADRLSVNIELPSEASLRLLAPHKTRAAILGPMAQIARTARQNRQELVRYRHTPVFAAAGQATQMIIGATPESDYQILRLAEGLYRKYALKRVFYSAYIPAVADSLLPTPDQKPPLLREHRLYQADFLLRQYHFAADEVLSAEHPHFSPYLDPKCSWALYHPQHFPVDVQTADYRTLLRVPGIGPKSARRILDARRAGSLSNADLGRMGVVLRRARYFILTRDQPTGVKLGREAIARALLDPAAFSHGAEQLSLFAPPRLEPAISGAAPTLPEAVEEVIASLPHPL